MEVTKEPDYRFYKSYLYPACGSSEGMHAPCGTAEVEITGHKGRLTCHSGELPGQLPAGVISDRLLVMLCRENDGEKTVIGCVNRNQRGQGICTWDFNTSGKGGRRTLEQIKYWIAVSAIQEGARIDKPESILMAGTLVLPGEVRDNRVIGFKKEATAINAGFEACDKNPLFQRVEPFQPPIPHTVWWQLSIQPNFSYYRQTDYCPRQKTYKAVF